MKTKFFSIVFALISIFSFGQTDLTQEQTDTLLSSNNFKEYLIYSVLASETGGVGYVLGLTSFADIPVAKKYLYSRQISQNPSVLYNDADIIKTFLILMVKRDFDKASSGPIETKIKEYLAASSRINFLVDDYFAERTRSW